MVVLAAPKRPVTKGCWRLVAGQLAVARTEVRVAALEITPAVSLAKYRNPRTQRPASAAMGVVGVGDRYREAMGMGMRAEVHQCKCPPPLKPHENTGDPARFVY